MIDFVLDPPSPTPSRRRDRARAPPPAGQIELIASENIVSRDVLEAQGSVLTNKYAEGYPGQALLRRLRVRRRGRDSSPSTGSRQLFGCGVRQRAAALRRQANQAVFLALLQPGDTIMGMSLAHGGHLTHGTPVTMSGKWFDASTTRGPRTSCIDYDDVAAPPASTSRS